MRSRSLIRSKPAFKIRDTKKQGMESVTMNKKLWLMIPVLFGAVYASSASAELLIGAKAGLVDYDVSGSDPGVNGSVQLGYEILNLIAADIAIEGELTTSLADGEIIGQDVGFESTGVYASLRTAGPVYFIGRVGYADTEIENVDDSGTSMGVGVGFSTLGLRWEVEYTTYEVKDVDVDYITLGLSF
jgi:hypothetical protein